MIALAFLVAAVVLGGAVGGIAWHFLSGRNKVDSQILSQVHNNHEAIRALQQQNTKLILNTNRATRQAIIDSIGMSAYETYRDGGDSCLLDS